jgi:adenylate cyclase
VTWLIVVGAVVVGTALLVWAGTPLFFNVLSPRTDGRRRARDDTYFFEACASGWMTRYRWFNRRLPADPRCRLCLVPFGGAGRILRIKPSRKNPNYCMGCFEMAPLGGHDMEIGVLFADIRGFTTWCEGRDPMEVERTLNRFYAISTAVMAESDAIIELVGDQVMALFLTTFPALRPGPRGCRVMVRSALDLLGRVDPLPVGVGLHYGVARVGNVGKGAVKDFTAVGDVINTGSRLQACAGPGEIVLSDEVFELIGEDYADARPVSLTLKGKSEPVAAHVL